MKTGDRDWTGDGTENERVMGAPHYAVIQLNDLDPAQPLFRRYGQPTGVTH